MSKYTPLSQMPFVTVEQVVRFREAALAVEKQNAELSAQLAISEHMYQSGCHFEDRCKELSAQVAELVEAAKRSLEARSYPNHVQMDAAKRLVSAIAKAVAQS